MPWPVRMLNAQKVKEVCVYISEIMPKITRDAVAILILTFKIYLIASLQHVFRNGTTSTTHTYTTNSCVQFAFFFINEINGVFLHLLIYIYICIYLHEYLSICMLYVELFKCSFEAHKCTYIVWKCVYLYQKQQQQR